MPNNDKADLVASSAHQLVKQLYAGGILETLAPTLMPEVLLVASAMAFRTAKSEIKDWCLAVQEAWKLASHELGMRSGIEIETPITDSLKNPDELEDESRSMVQNEHICAVCEFPLTEKERRPFSVEWECKRPSCGSIFVDIGPLGVRRLRSS